MYPPVYEVLIASGSLTGTISDRIFPFGQATQDTELPYATFQVIAGSPTNYLNKRPDYDLFSVQIDIYSRDGAEARSVAAAIRDVIETECHITGWRGESKDPKTQISRVGFDADWWVARS